MSKVCNFPMIIEVYFNGEVLATHVAVAFAHQKNVDRVAKRISAIMPNADIRVMCFARLKAWYKNGKRTYISDFYDTAGSMPEVYELTKILDTETSKWL